MMRTRRTALAGSAALAAVGMASLAGCPPSLEEPEQFQTGCPANFSVETLLRQQCAKSGCHAAGDAPAAGLDLESAGAFDRMFESTSPLCPVPIISPLGPDRSLLVAKLDGTATCGARMPLGGAPLAASEIACVRAWITSGIPGAMAVVPDAGVARDGGFDHDGGDPDAADAGTDAREALDAGDGGLADADGAG